MVEYGFGRTDKCVGHSANDEEVRGYCLAPARFFQRDMHAFATFDYDENCRLGMSFKKATSATSLQRRPETLIAQMPNNCV